MTAEVGASDVKPRLFFAALPDPITRECIAAAAASLHLEAQARRVPEASFHLTLAFIGEIPSRHVQILKEIGAEVRMPQFALRFDTYEYWPKPEVVVAAARIIPSALERLWLRLHAELAAHQWALDPKRLRPHITLARKVPQAPVLQAMHGFEWSAGEFSLMRSDGGGVQSAYTVVDTWPLLDDAGNP